MGVATMPETITGSIILPPDTPYTVVSRGAVDELEFRSKVVIQHAARAGSSATGSASWGRRGSSANRSKRP
jgi:hypothetical protein